MTHGAVKPETKPWSFYPHSETMVSVFKTTYIQKWMRIIYTLLF